MTDRRKGFTTIEMIIAGLAVPTAIASSILIYTGYKAVRKYINSPTKPMVERSNVIGNEKAEQFIDFRGKRYYSEIDGKSVEKLVK